MHAFSDRREIIAFGTPGSEPMRILENRVHELQCRLVDRDVDVRYVPITELEFQGDHRVDQALERLRRLRGDRDLPFELILVGKDRGVKARATSPAAIDEFIQLIDAMPMRRAEIRRGAGADGNCRDSTESKKGPQ